MDRALRNVTAIPATRNFGEESGCWEGRKKKNFADFVLNISIMADLAAVRSELGTVRWAIGLLAALVFAIGLRLFGSIR